VAVGGRIEGAGVNGGAHPAEARVNGGRAKCKNPPGWWTLGAGGWGDAGLGRAA
jgi:hypothetical protein